MSRLLVVYVEAATIHKREHLPEGTDQDAVQEAWENAVHDASERFKAEHPEWFIC